MTSSLICYSQDKTKMQIWMKDGNMYQLPVETVDSIAFIINSEFRDWNEILRSPSLYEINRYNNTSDARSPYIAAWLDTDTEENFTQFSIDFKADYIPTATYCSLCNFYICQNCFVNPKNFNSAFNPFNPGQNYNPNQFSGNNIRNNGQNFNGFNGNQNNNYNNNGNYNNNNNFNNNNNNGNQGYNNFPNNNNRKDFTNNSGAGGIDFGQNIFNNQINNSNNSNNNNNYGNNINNNQPFNNINNMQNNDVSNNSINSNKTNTSAIINNLVANNPNKIDNNQINNNIPNNNKDKTHQNEDDQIDTYLSGNQLQYKQNHQNNQ